MLNVEEMQSKYDNLITALFSIEVAQKERYNSAIDIVDTAEFTAVTIDAQTKILQVRKWIEDLRQMESEVINTFFNSGVQTIKTENVGSPVDKSDDLNAISKENPASSCSTGEYVRQKLYALSESGYVFSDEQLHDMQSSEWSRQVLNLPHPFVRIYDDKEDILTQTSIDGVPRRYWVKDKIQFGSIILLVYGGWSPGYKISFDAWYNSILDSQPKAEETASAIISHKQEEEEIGVYVREKLSDLCNLGYQPSAEEIASFCQKQWSKEVLNLNFPFARVYDSLSPIHDQLSAIGGSNRFWSEVFNFGNCQLLFSSEWCINDRIYFDRWYDNLVIEDIANLETTSEVLVGAENDGTDDMPREITLFDTVYPFSSWRNAFQILCEIMVLKKPYKVAKIGLDSDKLPEFPMLSFDEQRMVESSIKLSNGLFADISGSAGEVRLRCEQILKMCGYNNNDVLQISSR